MHILLLEDTPGIQRFLVKGLGEEGHRVTAVADLQAARAALLDTDFDALVVDRMLPDGDGLDIVRELRRAGSRVPCLCLTARDRVDERVEGLRSGADDYLVKPFAFEELVARLEAMTRRTGVGEQLQLGDVHVDLAARRVSRDGEAVPLTQREFDLLVALVRSAGRVVSRTRLLEQVWDMSFDPGTNRVDVYVGYLRRKLGGDLIETVRGIGYIIPSERLSGRT